MIGVGSTVHKTPKRLVQAAIGVLAGFASGLLGISGGVILVGAMMMLLGFSARVAMGTSLAAMVPILLVGIASFGLVGEVEWRSAAVVGVPAIAGTAVGIWLQQRIASHVLAGLFALFLLVVAIRLLIA